MIGLGVGIDYSLFIVTRYRENLADGHRRRSRGRPLGRHGRLRRCCSPARTVVIAICGLAVSGIPYVARLGYMSALVVAVMMLAAITLLPAIIGVVGHDIDRWKVPSLHPPSRPRGARGRSPQPPGHVLGALGHARRRHAWPFAIVAVDRPAASSRRRSCRMRLGESDDGNLPDVHDAAPGLRPRRPGLRARHQRSAARRRAAAVAGDDAVARPTSRARSRRRPGVQAVLPAADQPERRRSRRSACSRPPRPTARRPPTSCSTLRSYGAPAAAVGTSGAQAYVGGVTATFIDIGDRISSRLPYFIGAVVLLSFLLLMLVFHSILVPLTAAVMNLLSVGGRVRRDRRGVPVGLGEGPHRPREHGAHRVVRADDDVRGAVRPVDGLPGVPAHAGARGVRPHAATRVKASCAGLARTARVITSAALIMIFVFGAFVAEPDARGEDVRPRARVRGARRRDDRAHDARAVDHGDPRRRQLVVPEVARLPPPPRHRGATKHAPDVIAPRPEPSAPACRGRTPEFVQELQRPARSGGR